MVAIRESYAPKVEIAVDAGLAVSPGNLLYYHSGDAEFKLADADAIASPAQLVAVRAAYGGRDTQNKTVGARRALIYDAAGGFTAQAPLYLSGTAGAYTQTRPVGIGDLRQVVGWAHTTKLAEINIKEPYELEVVGQEALLIATAARLAVDVGPAAGVTLAAAGDGAVWHVPIPQNAVAIVYGRAQYSSDVTLDVTDTINWEVSSALEGEANDVVTDTIAIAGEANTADEIGEYVLTTGLNAANMVKPGGSLFIKVDKDAEGSAGDDMVIFNPVVTFRCV